MILHVLAGSSSMMKRVSDSDRPSSNSCLCIITSENTWHNHFRSFFVADGGQTQGPPLFSCPFTFSATSHPFSAALSPSVPPHVPFLLPFHLQCHPAWPALVLLDDAWHFSRHSSDRLSLRHQPQCHAQSSLVVLRDAASPRKQWTVGFLRSFESPQHLG